MCGIVGYEGNGNIRDVLIDSLGLLEYRGYDSAGIALVSREDLKIARTFPKRYTASLRRKIYDLRSWARSPERVTCKLPGR